MFGGQRSGVPMFNLRLNPRPSVFHAARRPTISSRRAPLRGARRGLLFAGFGKAVVGGIRGAWACGEARWWCGHAAAAVPVAVPRQKAHDSRVSNRPRAARAWRVLSHAYAHDDPTSAHHDLCCVCTLCPVPWCACCQPSLWPCALPEPVIASCVRCGKPRSCSCIADACCRYLAHSPAVQQEEGAR